MNTTTASLVAKSQHLLAAENRLANAQIALSADAPDHLQRLIREVRELLDKVCPEHSAPIEQLIKLKDDRIAQLTKALATAHSLLAPRKIDEPVNHQ